MKRYLSLLILLPGMCFVASAQKAIFNTIPAEQGVGSNFEFIATGDLNGDGRIDIAGATTYYFDSSNDHKIFIWLQGANGQMQAPQKFPYMQPGVALGFVISRIYAGQNPRILICVNNYLNIYAWSNNKLVLEESIKTMDNDPQKSVATADFDGDGLMDIAISHGSIRLTILYQNASGTPKWDIVNHAITGIGGSYNMPHIIAGKFGSLTQNAVISVNNALGNELSVFTFSSARSIQKRYDMQLPTGTTPGSKSPHSITLVSHGSSGEKKGGGVAKNELWMSYGGNKPSSKVAIWRDLQALPDSVFDVLDVPEAIQAADLDCDGGDEIVLLHGGWLRATVVSDTMDFYQLGYQSHYNPESLALGDVNNDGAPDICIANGTQPQNMLIFYNQRPCWPASTQHLRVSETELSLYPNPANSTTTITCNANGRLRITDVQGSIVNTADFDRKATIDVSSLSPGLYFAILYCSDGQIIKKKFARQ